MSLLGGLATLAGQTLVLLAVVVALRAWWRRRRQADGTPVLTAAVLGIASVVILLSTTVHAANTLHRAHQTSVGPRRGLTYCFEETEAVNRLAFVNWLRQRMPEHAAYALALAPQPDAWCFTQALLPRVPSFGADHPHWLVVYGTSPPSVQAMIAHHDPAVQVFAPGFALVRVP